MSISGTNQNNNNNTNNKLMELSLNTQICNDQFLYSYRLFFKGMYDINEDGLNFKKRDLTSL